MFEKLKQIGKLREVQKSLEEEEVETEKNGTRVVLNGNLKVINISLNPELEKEEQEKILRSVLMKVWKKLNPAWLKNSNPCFRFINQQLY